MVMFEWLKIKWCSWFHGGGDIKHDPSGKINWQCRKCGRWCDPVSSNPNSKSTDKPTPTAYDIAARYAEYCRLRYKACAMMNVYGRSEEERQQMRKDYQEAVLEWMVAEAAAQAALGKGECGRGR
jgi:hypothetical protein